MNDSNEQFVIIHKDGNPNGDVKHVINANVIRKILFDKDTDRYVLVLDMDEIAYLNNKETEELKSQLEVSI